MVHIFGLLCTADCLIARAGLFGNTVTGARRSQWPVFIGALMANGAVCTPNIHSCGRYRAMHTLKLVDFPVESILRELQETASSAVKNN
jgi:hypothetical protein